MKPGGADTLLVGFDSAWTAGKDGALVGILRAKDGALQELGPAVSADFNMAEKIILDWQAQHTPATTLVLLDQPTIVKNRQGQRPVENIVASPVGRRRGGVQPANTGKKKEMMFGKKAPVWKFLSRFGGPANPLERLQGTSVVETFPVLTMIALNWMLPDSRPLGRLPKYNPARRKTFREADWNYVCRQTSKMLRNHGLRELVNWLDSAAKSSSPRKGDQDRLDACICLLVALHLGESNQCLMIGDQETGYMVVPYGKILKQELVDRSRKTGRDPDRWVRSFHAQLHD